MNKAGIIGLAVAGSLLLGTLVVAGHDLFTPHAARQASKPEAGLPWQMETLPGGASKVMGLTLAMPGQTGGSTLADAQRQWGDGMQIAIVAAPGEDGALEAFVDPARAGFITGKAVITARVPADKLRAMRERAVKSEFMESTTRKYTVSPDDLREALLAPIAALSFIPQANLDADTVIARFGQPAERLRANPHAAHFLYPAIGLDLLLDSEGKELLQYVAPGDFDRLRQPLRVNAARPAPSSP